MQDLRRIIWLASYPKSGNTWVRTFLANYFIGGREAVDINSLRRFTLSETRQDFYDRAAGKPFRGEIFDDSMRLRTKVQRLVAGAKPGTHFVKTHSKIEQIGPIPLIDPAVTAAAIYILRNPFDVAPSYARHHGVDIDAAIGALTNPKNVTYSESMICDVLGGWDRHAASWLGAPGLPLHFVRYEDLLADPKAEFSRILEFLKAPVKTADLRRTLKLTSFNSLKRQEEEKGFVERPAHMRRFFHSGVSGGWREALSGEQVARLHTAFEPALRKWYPELVEETAEIAAQGTA